MWGSLTTLFVCIACLRAVVWPCCVPCVSTQLCAAGPCCVPCVSTQLFVCIACLRAVVWPCCLPCVSTQLCGAVKTGTLYSVSQEHRRKRGDVIKVYKYLHGFYKVSRPDFHIARNVMRSTRGNSLKLQKPWHRLSVRGNYFANRVEQPPRQCGNSTIG